MSVACEAFAEGQTNERFGSSSVLILCLCFARLVRGRRMSESEMSIENSKRLVRRLPLFLRALGLLGLALPVFGCETAPLAMDAASADAPAVDVRSGEDAGVDAASTDAPTLDVRVDVALSDGGADAGTDAPLATGDAGADAPMRIAIAGTYTDGFSMQEVSSSRWTMSGPGFMAGFAIVRFDNTQGWAIAQNDASNAFAPSLFSRFEWVERAGVLYMCQDPFDAVTEAAALAASRPDRTDPATSGCGSFPWSVLTPVL